MLDFGNRKSLKIVEDFPSKWAGRPSKRAVSEGPTSIEDSASRARRPAGHGKRYKNSIEVRLSFSRALTRYKNRVQSVLCHWTGAGHVAESFCKSGPERIFKTELLAIPCVPPFGAVCVFRHSRLGARSAVPGCMRVPPFPVRCTPPGRPRKRYKNRT